LAEELGDVGREHLQHLVIPTELLLLTHRAVELITPDIPGDLAAEILDPRGPVKHRALIELGKDTRHRHVRQMLHQPVHVVEEIGLVVGGGAATGPPIHLADKGEATAWEISGLPRRLATIAPLELVKVRVVDGAVEDVAGAPREARLARGAPHLITPRFLEDEHATLLVGAVLGVVTECLDRIHIILLALVCGIPCQPLAAVALGTEEVITETALVAGGDATAAFITGTGHEEVGAGCLCLYHRLFFGGRVGLVDETVIAQLGAKEAMLGIRNLLLDPNDLLTGGLLKLLIPCRLLEVAHMSLSLRQ